LALVLKAEFSGENVELKCRIFNDFRCLILEFFKSSAMARRHLKPDIFYHKTQFSNHGIR
jgi:hypothetical protein